MSKLDPRNNEDDAFAAFMSMPLSEWRGLLISLSGGGVLTPAEDAGFKRALGRRAELNADTEELKRKLEGCEQAIALGLPGFQETHDWIVAELQRRGEV
jgi:hypothetical protein